MHKEKLLTWQLPISFGRKGVLFIYSGKPEEPGLRYVKESKGFEGRKENQF